jgi:hypothetical protein
MRRAILAALALAGAGLPAMAIEWVEATRPDPFAEGATCAVHEPLSSGSYIYDYPSKYDIVFWPFTDPYWIWSCPKSGFISFGTDFDKITDAERPRIAALLEQQRAAGGLGGEPIDTLEAIYRKRDNVDWSWLDRVLAQWHVEDAARADAYRKAAVPLLEAALADAKGLDRIEKLYLLGAYAHRFGDKARAAKYFTEARATAWTDDDGKSQVGSSYINALIQDVSEGALDKAWGAAPRR